MRIIIWNCNMAFRRKAKQILTLKPNIIIVPECESLEKLKFTDETLLPKDKFWFGEKANKGLGVFTYGNYSISKNINHNKEYRFVVPLLIDNEIDKFNLIAVWAQKPDTHNNYGIQVWNAINYYSDLLKEEKLINAGDFNSNSIWDKPNREANHSNIVKLLNEKEILSTYHYYSKEEQGKETKPTLFLQKKLNRKYHIDYCFASKTMINKLKNVAIGNHENWIKYSDHAPLIVTFDD